MIGIIFHEDGTVFEFWPIFGAEKGIPRWTQLRTNLVINDRKWGEYGFSFSRHGRHINFWWQWKSTTWPWDLDRLKRFIRRSTQSKKL
jgi:hypothetical protein